MISKLGQTMLKNFSDVLQEIRVEVIKSLYSLFIILGIYTSVIYIIGFLRPNIGINIRIIIFFVITIITTFLFVYIRSRLNTKNYRKAQYIFIAFFFVITIIYTTTYGTYSFLTAPLIILLTVPPIIVIGKKISQRLFIAITVLLLIISTLHLLGIKQINSLSSGSDYDDLLIIIILVWVIFNVAKVGFSQIERSYSEAITYSNELEKLNKILDQQVKDRTEKLRQGFDERVKNIYDNSVLGSISKSLIHDISSPISALKGSLEIIKLENDQEFIRIAHESVTEIENIINESRQIMQGRDIEEKINVTKTIKTVLNILKTHFLKKNIKVIIENKNEGNILIKGSKASFSRVLINIIVNAIEELSNLNINREITITTFLKEDKINIAIKDNGRGIPKDQINKIFNEDFTLKSNGYNLGLGLPFVKKTIEEDFMGTIEVKSIRNKYTEIILSFKVIPE